MVFSKSPDGFWILCLNFLIHYKDFKRLTGIQREMFEKILL